MSNSPILNIISTGKEMAINQQRPAFLYTAVLIPNVAPFLVAYKSLSNQTELSKLVSFGFIPLQALHTLDFNHYCTETIVAFRLFNSWIWLHLRCHFCLQSQSIKAYDRMDATNKDCCSGQILQVTKRNKGQLEFRDFSPSPLINCHRISQY